MSFADKIEEWMKEAEERPESAALILRLVLGRLRELTERNEALLAENIALQSGTRAEEYRKRAAHLEYQLELLKKRFGLAGDLPEGVSALPVEKNAQSLLIYRPRGHLLRVPLGDLSEGAIGALADEPPEGGEAPRLLCAPAREDLLLLFTSGRVEVCPADAVPALEAGGVWRWERAALPHEPRAGETLACVLPLSRLPLADFFLQISRRGFVKKTPASVSESVLQNRYLGKGAIHKSDQPLDLLLCGKKDRVALASREGKALALEADALSFSPEERLRLTATDYLVASFTFAPQDTLLFVAQNGKAVARAGADFEVSSSSSKGYSLIPASRLQQGVRFAGALAAGEGDWLAALDSSGGVSVYPAEALTGAGAIPVEGTILSVARIGKTA